MEILGSTFDDSMFVEARDRESVALKSYNAKVCEPQWYCVDVVLDTNDSLKKQKVMKFKGDLAVRKGEHQKAFDAYSACLEWISDNNLNIRRDVLEGMARCCIKRGQKDKALDLQVSIYHHYGDVEAKISCLQQLCSLLPFNPWHWLDLGHTCLLLLRILQQQQSSFVLKRSEKALEETDKALQQLNPTETTIQVMSEDLIPEKMREDYQDGESLATVCVQSFRERWW
uniref:Uncharacterized protein n=1 Tax=Periophthalmus magnuspinnatus TaxID=409849 RepID=A0A3B4AVY7_9GOBI